MNYPIARKALAIVDGFAAEADALLEAAKTDREVEFWQHVDLLRGDFVRQAFLCDTADRNRWSSVRCMPLSDIRRMVAGK